LASCCQEGRKVTVQIFRAAGNSRIRNTDTNFIVQPVRERSDETHSTIGVKIDEIAVAGTA
jgi:hypothetical protein